MAHPDSNAAPDWRRARRQGRAVPLVAVTSSILLVSGLLSSPAASAATAPAGATPTSAAKPASVLSSWVARTRATAPKKVALTTEEATTQVTKASALSTSSPSGLDPKLVAEAATTPAGTVSVQLSGDQSATRRAVLAAGGHVTAAAGTELSATIPKSSLASVAGGEGVLSAKAPTKAYATTSAVSQGIGLSHADTWQSAGYSGAGETIAIVDLGFAGNTAGSTYTSEITAGNLSASPGTILGGNYCDPASSGDSTGDLTTTEHGTAVAEIVHQEAPSAKLVLYCISDNVGFASAEADIQSKGIKIVTSSLGFPGDSRGDGSGDSTSAAATVKKARQAGILWIQSAGNNGEDHWSGTLTDSNRDGFVDLPNSPDGNQVVADAFILRPGDSAEIVLQWDEWPTASTNLTLHADGFSCPLSDCSCPDNQPTVCPTSLAQPQSVPSDPGQGPTLEIAVTNNGPNYEEWDPYITLTAGHVSSTRFDLSYWGNAGQSYFAAVYPAQAAAGSITEPASSPYALAVGASAAVVNGPTSVGSVELYSSQGPTIDGRTKPDISAWDCVWSNLSDLSMFCGTSAAAPHVAGAAAILRAASGDSLDAAQLQDALERRATGTTSPTNTIGHGNLSLGDSTKPVAAPTGSGYTPITPVRVLDTRAQSSVGGRTTPLGPSGTLTLTLSSVPAGTTAVAVNLTGVGATQAGFLSVYPGGTATPSTSNLNLSPPTRATAAVFAVVTLGTGNQISVFNASGSTDVVIDVMGYFGTSQTGRYAATTPQRILDTRTTSPLHIAANRSVTVNSQINTGGTSTAVPSNATAVVLNVTAVNPSSAGWLNVSGSCSSTNSSVNYAGGSSSIANLVITNVVSGSFCVFNGTGAAMDAAIDIVGYFSPTATAKFVPLPGPVRITDTRIGNGSLYGRLGSATPLTTGAGGIFDTPYSAVAILTGVVSVGASQPGFLTVYPAGGTKPVVSTLNFVGGDVIPNAAIANLNSSSGGAAISNSGGTVDVVVDLFGYFV